MANTSAPMITLYTLFEKYVLYSNSLSLYNYLPFKDQSTNNVKLEGFQQSSNQVYVDIYDW